MILVLGKTRSHRVTNLGCRRAESPGWFDVLPKNSTRDVVHEWAHCCDEAANHQLPIAAAFWITLMVSSEECSSLMQNLMKIYCSTLSVILNVVATQYTCSENGAYHPQWLVRWHCHWFMHVHSSLLFLVARLHQCCANCSHYINNGSAFSRPTSCVWTANHFTEYLELDSNCLTVACCQRDSKVSQSTTPKYYNTLHPLSCSAILG